MEALGEGMAAVGGAAKPAAPGAEDVADPSLHLRFAVQQLDYTRDIPAAAAQEGECLRGLRADELIDRALIVRGERLRSKAGPVAARGEGQVHLRRPASQEHGIAEVR